MSRFNSYINTANTILDTYKGEIPLNNFLKHFFAGNKKFGSRDRRQVTALCYNYFRLGLAAPDISRLDKMLVATFLCVREPSELLEQFKPEWNEKVHYPLAQKISLAAFPVEDIFPFIGELSDGIDAQGFCKSFLVQPDLFIRIRPRTRLTVLRKLERSKLSWKLLNEDCVQMNVSEKLEELFIINKEVVIQDYNSQKVLDYLRNGSGKIGSLAAGKAGLSVWDCCAASGGKSILLYDIFDQKINLTVSDIRENIILKLHGRFKKAGIKEYRYFIADISNAGLKPEGLDFDLIICDAPCTGSGTWSRTPEQLYFFKPTAIAEYAELQKKIVTNVIPYLQTGGLFIYITCSVFRKENEAVSAFISSHCNCKLLQQQALRGYDKKADNMFVAVFEKVKPHRGT